MMIVDNEWVDSKIKTCAEEDADHHDQHQRCALGVSLTHLPENIKITIRITSGLVLIVMEFWSDKKREKYKTT